MDTYVNIHTHRPTGCGIELRTAGVHPWYADRESVASILPQLETAQAVGETGLDALRGPDHEIQLTRLREQLALARRRGLPVVLHCVQTFEELMDEVARCEPRAVIFHGFIGSPEQARRAFARGYYLSFGERSLASRRACAALRAVPLDRLFLETDESELSIAEIYARAAAVRGTTVGELQRATLENYERIFGK